MKVATLAVFTTMATAATAALAPAALAGGLAEPTVAPVISPVAPQPVVSPGGDWTGAYGGVNLGYGDIGSSPAGSSGNGPLYGIRGGYDHDFGNFVLGGSVHYDFADIDLTGGDKLDSVASLRLRGGYDLGRTLIYASAGVAQANATVGGVSLDDTGYVLGLGSEVMVTQNVSVTGEVTYQAFDDFGGTGTDIDKTAVGIGVNYRF